MNERLSDAKRMELEGRVEWMEEGQIRHLEQKFGEAFLRTPREVQFDILGPGMGVFGALMMGGVALYTGSKLLDDMGLPMTFHHSVQTTWEYIKYSAAPEAFESLFLFAKGVGVGVLGIAGYKCAKSIAIKVNGKKTQYTIKKQRL